MTYAVGDRVTFLPYTFPDNSTYDYGIVLGPSVYGGAYYLMKCYCAATDTWASWDVRHDRLRLSALNLLEAL